MMNTSSVKALFKLENWHWIVLALLSLVLAPCALHRLAADYWMGGYENDFLNYYEAALRWLAGGELYAFEQGFVYPPPAVLLFVPLTLFSCHTAYILFSAASFLFLIAAILMVMSLMRTAGFTLSRPLLSFLILLSLALAPTFENAAWGQVNTLVLLSAVSFFWLLEKDRPWQAGLVLALGTWLKVYPALLLWVVVLMGWKARPQSFRVVLSFTLALFLIPLVLLPFLSPQTYQEFSVQVLPAASSIAKPRIMNQSLIGAIARWSLGPVDTLMNIRIPMTAWMDWSNKVLLLASLVGLTWWGVGRRGAAGNVVPAALKSWAGATSPAPEQRRPEVPLTLVTHFLLLACIPVFSPLGWCYVYVLVYPLIFLALMTARDELSKLLVVFAILAFMIPAHHIISGAQHLPLLFQHLLYSRYLPATVLLAMLVVKNRISPTEFKHWHPIGNGS